MPAMNETSIIIALLIAFGAGALVVWVLLLRHEPYDEFELDLLTIDRYPPPARPWHDRISPALITVAIILVLVATVSWASNRDREARLAERAADIAAQTVARHAAATRVPPKISINRWNVVEVDVGRCYGAANVRKKTTFVSCAD